MKLVSEEKIDFSTSRIASIITNKNEVCFFENYRKALCRANLETGEVKIEKVIKEDIKIGEIAWYKDKYFLFSLIGLYVYIYDTIEQKEYKICANMKQFEKIKVISLYKRIDNKMFFLPVELICFDGILMGPVFDMDKEEFSIISFSPSGNILNQKVCYFDYPSSNGKVISAALIYTNMYLNINLITEQYELNCVNVENVHLSSISKDESGIWMTQKDSSVIIHVQGSNNKEIQFFPIKGKVSRQPYSHIYCLKKYIIVLPRYGHKIILIEKGSDRIFIVKINDDVEEQKLAGTSKCITYIESNDKIYLLPFNMRAGIIIDTKTMESYRLNLWCEKEHFFSAVYQSLNLCRENKGLILQGFIEFIKADKKGYSKMLLQKEQSIGGEIWREV